MVMLEYKYNSQSLTKYGRIFAEKNIGNYSAKTVSSQWLELINQIN